MLQGSPKQLDELCGRLRERVPAARVDRLDVAPVQPPPGRMDSFERLPTL